MNADRLASDIANTLIRHECEHEVKAGIADAVLRALGYRVDVKRGPRKPDWDKRDRFLAPHEKRFASMLRAVWAEERRVMLANMKRHPVPKAARVRKDPIFIDYWMYPSTQYAKEISGKGHKLLIALMDAAIAAVIVEYELEISFELVNERAVQWLNTYVPQLSANLEKVNTDELRQALLEGFNEGEGMDKLARRVNDIFDTYDKVRAERISRTETIRAQAEGNLETYKEAGFERKVWIANPGACEDCLELDNKDVPIDEPFFLPNPWNAYSDGMTPPYHPNCVLPGTRVITSGDWVAGVRAMYDGPAIELIFAGGSRISVTPNHMFLTPNGFAAANLLRKGDDVFYCPDFERIITIDPYNHGKPTVVEEIVGSLTKTGGMLISRVPMSPEYLHGDARFCDGDIDVIGPDGLLRNAGESALTHPLGENDFGAADPEPSLFSSRGPFAFLLKGMLASFGGSMSGHRQSSPFFLRRLAHANNSRLMPSARNDSSFEKPYPDRATANSELIGNGLFGNSGSIQINDELNIKAKLLFGIDIGMGTSGDGSGIPKADSKPIGITTNLLSDTSKGQPGLVKTTRLVEIKPFIWHGFVYDLQSQTSLYIGNGILSSNCRCDSAPWDPSWAD